MFDELHDHLLLKHLLSQLPAPFSNDQDIIKSVENIFRQLAPQSTNFDAFTLLSLIGMILPEIQVRRNFLRSLLHWDFQTFCSCLAHISPTGRFARCEADDLRSLAEELREWYGFITLEGFPKVQPVIDPWLSYRSENNASPNLGIKLRASPGCREVTYWYKAVQNSDELVEASQTTEYPTWYLTFSQGDEVYKLHDPDNGLVISIFRGGPDGTQRTINFSVHPPFPGASLNIPERIALFDVGNEVVNLIENGYLPHEPIFLVEERIRAILPQIPGLAPLESLTLEILQGQIPRLLAQFPHGSTEFVTTQSRLEKLEFWLSRTRRPLSANSAPSPDNNIPEFDIGAPMHNRYSDNALQEYLAYLMRQALLAYKMIVDANFPALSKSLITYVHFPCSVLIVTDRKSVRYMLIPVDDEADAIIRCAILPFPEFDVANPEARVQIDDVPLEEHVWNKLNGMGKKRPPVHPVNVIASIESFFSSTPTNDLVKSWLKSDLRKIFGF